MGQKVRPSGFRVGITEPWLSRWYANKADYGKLLVEDVKIRRHIKQRYGYAGIPKVEIERKGDQMSVLIFTARPGLLIGKRGARVEELRGDLEGLLGRLVQVDVREVEEPSVSAQLLAEGVAEQLSRRQSFRRAVRRTLEVAREAGALGVKVQVSGRLGGAEMSRRESASSGTIPLQTLDAKIDYGFQVARTTAGVIGVKVWVYTGLHPKDKGAASDGAHAQAR